MPTATRRHDPSATLNLFPSELPDPGQTAEERAEELALWMAQDMKNRFEPLTTEQLVEFFEFDPQLARLLPVLDPMTFDKVQGEWRGLVNRLAGRSSPARSLREIAAREGISLRKAEEISAQALASLRAKAPEELREWLHEMHA